ncbi:hypothetical protein LDENG_00141590 [Lucifuga dentata]|nr:hypothetical protein LDENG_00141590 [Lucifuga dentata]
MLQCVLTGRMQEAYCSLSPSESSKYFVVKSAILKDLMAHFSHWRTSLDICTVEDLSELIVLEQFKNLIPENTAIHISDQKVKTVSEAAALVDKYVLMHKHNVGEHQVFGK